MPAASTCGLSGSSGSTPSPSSIVRSRSGIGGSGLNGGFAKSSTMPAMVPRSTAVHSFMRCSLGIWRRCASLQRPPVMVKWHQLAGRPFSGLAL